jgi:hypothetical protein
MLSISEPLIEYRACPELFHWCIMKKALAARQQMKED